MKLKWPLLPHRRKVAEILLYYDALHQVTCPQHTQGYWRMRPECKPIDLRGKDELPCTCGLDEILGYHDTRAFN